MIQFRNLIHPLSRYNSIELEFSGDIPEEPAGALSGVFGGGGKLTFGGLERILAGAGRADTIRCIAIKIRGLSVGIARANTIRRRLLGLRERGKRVIVYLEGGGNVEYLIASAGDEIFMPPWAMLNLVGLGAEVTFLKDTLEKLGVEAQIKGLGKYKSAAEKFTRDSISDAHREMMESILDDLQTSLERSVAAGRGIGPGEIKDIINDAPFVAEEALRKGLIDGIAYENELTDRITQITGLKVKSISGSRFHRYLKLRDGVSALLGRITGGPLVAVLSATGTVTSGHGRGSGGIKTMGSGSLIKTLDRISGNKRVKALVLRISTPGGSGLASDVIRKKLRLISERIPVVVSMSDVAASGGYMIALGAGKIVADPMSLTGSIGIVSGKFNVRGLHEKLGVRTELFPAAKNALMYSPSRGFSVDEELKLSETLKFYYDEFVRLVSEGRGISAERAEESAQGRVWTGAQAKDRGLVDELGGLYEAVTLAAKEAGLPDDMTPLVELYYEKRRIKLTSFFKAGAYLDAFDGILDFASALSRESCLALLPFKIDVK